MNRTKRKVSSTFKREIPLEFQERIYPLADINKRRMRHRRMTVATGYHCLLARGTSKMQALVAVMRKLLHAIFGIFKHHQPYNGAKLFPYPIPQEVIAA
jgi:hypothetical protein